MDIDKDGVVKGQNCYEAMVNNHSKNAYNATAAWLDGKGRCPARLPRALAWPTRSSCKTSFSTKLRAQRDANGALHFASHETRAQFGKSGISGMHLEEQNRAQKMIEDQMVAANVAGVKFLNDKGMPHVERVVVTPEKWDKIVQVAQEHNFPLPAQPDAKALKAFLDQQEAKDPEHYPDLSLDVIKLIGRGQYVFAGPGMKTASTGRWPSSTTAASPPGCASSPASSASA